MLSLVTPNLLGPSLKPGEVYRKYTGNNCLVPPTHVCGDTVLQSYTVLDGGSDRLPSFCWHALERMIAALERMIAAIVISDSDSDLEFERDVQEATRLSLMTVAPSSVRYTLCRWLRLIPSPLLAFWGELRNETKLVISSKQYRGLDSGPGYASFVSRQLPVACSTSGTILQAMGSWVRALNKAISI